MAFKMKIDNYSRILNFRDILSNFFNILLNFNTILSNITTIRSRKNKAKSTNQTNIIIWNFASKKSTPSTWGNRLQGNAPQIPIVSHTIKVPFPFGIQLTVHSFTNYIARKIEKTLSNEYTRVGNLHHRLHAFSLSSYNIYTLTAK